MTMKYAHILNFLESHPWAILPDTFDAIVSLMELRASGFHLTASEIESRIGARHEQAEAEVRGHVAVVPIHGTISRRLSMLERASGGTSIEAIRRDFRAAVNNPKVSSIVLDVDSPGGSTSGLQELADEIHGARDKVHIAALANGTMASAAYYLGSQAHEVIATPSAIVGSIGAIAVHFDESKRLDEAGVKATIVKAGKFKGEGSELEPLSDEARDHLQDMVDQRYAEFVDAVARGRGVSAGEVRNGFGQGRVVLSREAKKIGMVDAVQTMDQAVARQPKRRPRVAAASVTVPQFIAIDPESRQTIEVDFSSMTTTGNVPSASAEDEANAKREQEEKEAAKIAADQRRRELELLELEEAG